MTQRALPQNKEALLKSYNKRLKDDVKSLLDNLTGYTPYYDTHGIAFIYIFSIFRNYEACQGGRRVTSVKNDTV